MTIYLVRHRKFLGAEKYGVKIKKYLVIIIGLKKLKTVQSMKPQKE